MRDLADSARIERFMTELGRTVQVDSRVYFTGGANMANFKRFLVGRAGLEPATDGL